MLIDFARQHHEALSDRGLCDAALGCARNKVIWLLYGKSSEKETGIRSQCAALTKQGIAMGFETNRSCRLLRPGIWSQFLKRQNTAG